MNEIKLTLDDPRVEMRALQLAVERLASTPLQGAAQILTHLHDSIEEQVKPAIEEPIAFGSVVRVKTGTLFVRVGAMEPLPWASGDALREWSDLDVVEVLRVGIGEAPGDAYARGYEDGVESNLPSPVDRSNIRSALQDLGWGSGSVELATDAVMKALS